MILVIARDGQEIHYPEFVQDLPAVPRRGDLVRLMVDKKQKCYERPELPEEGRYVVERVDWHVWLFCETSMFVDVVLKEV